MCVSNYLRLALGEFFVHTQPPVELQYVSLGMHARVVYKGIANLTAMQSGTVVFVRLARGLYQSSFNRLSKQLVNTFRRMTIVEPEERGI